jgi:hypothetical protein
VRKEIDMVLAQIGCAAFESLGPEYLWPPPAAAPPQAATPPSSLTSPIPRSPR